MTSDGRNIDQSRGTLSGEGHEMMTTNGPWPLALKTPDTYYDHPVLKKSPWSWDIPAYYYVGGATGALMTLGAAATLLNGEAQAGQIAKSRWLATAGASLSAVLLIHDLGRPARFFNMLRVFRPTSPMSMGTWILMSFSGATGLAALTGSKFLTVVGGVLGLGLSGYTGVLISNTTVPVWHQPHRLMPVLFLSSSAASAASLLDLLPGNEQEHQSAKVYGIAGKVAELVTAVLIEKEVATVPEVARPLYEGVSGKLWQAGKIFSAASLALALIPNPSNKLRRLTGILGTAGSICIRFGIHYAGQASADNPRATFHQQREQLRYNNFTS